MVGGGGRRQGARAPGGGVGAALVEELAVGGLELGGELPRGEPAKVL